MNLYKIDYMFKVDPKENAMAVKEANEAATHILAANAKDATSKVEDTEFLAVAKIELVFTNARVI